MKGTIGHLRANAIAYLALFVALGGTGYAAISIPAGSVGTRQLRNGAVTSSKLDGRSIAGYVAFWARIDQSGGVLSSSRHATTAGWTSGTGAITFRGQLPANCVPLAGVGANATIAGYSEAQSISASGTTRLLVEMRIEWSAQPVAVDVVEICP